MTDPRPRPALRAERAVSWKPDRALPEDDPTSRTLVRVYISHPGGRREKKLLFASLQEALELAQEMSREETE